MKKCKLIFCIVLLINFCCSSAQSHVLYGATYQGGANGFATIFSLDIATDSLKDVYDFDSLGGYRGEGSLVQAGNGLLYGMTQLGGSAGKGVIFSFNPVSRVYTKLFDFTGPNGANPQQALLPVGDSLLFGMTPYGGTSGNGILFSYNIYTNHFNPLLSFNGANGSLPTGSLMRATNGLLYGMTQDGGSQTYGVIFSYNPDSSLYVKVHDFDYTNGANPWGTLMQASDGYFYGMTYGGGISGGGVFFALDSSNAYFPIFTFTNDHPTGGLMEASNGLLYGETYDGGVSMAGQIFSFDINAWTDSMLFNFSYAEGEFPGGYLLQASNGLLYGLASGGGPGMWGDIFSYNTITNTYNIAASFNHADGGNGGLNGLVEFIYPTLSIKSSDTAICSGVPVTFTASVSGAGVAPVYRWMKNGLPVGTDSKTYIDSTLVSNDSVWCIVTAAWVSPVNDTSNKIKVAVSGSLPMSLSIASNPAVLCSGQNATFTATAINAGTSPVYQWKVNHVTVGTNSPSYTGNNLRNNDTIQCFIAGSGCVHPLDTFSNSQVVGVSPVLSIRQSSPGCLALDTLTVSGTYLGSNFMWYQGTNLVATLPSSDSIYLPGASGSYTVQTTNLNGCNAVSNALTALSDTAIISVSASVNPVCNGRQVTFTASPVYSIASASYQWKINGTNVGTNSNFFSTSTLHNNDVVTCVLTTNALCGSVASATSNVITMTVNGNVVPTASISANPSGAVCSGTNVTFTASTTNAGPFAFPEWLVNGISSGSYGNSFTIAASNNETVKCILYSNATCATPDSATSNTITITATGPPSVTISQSPAGTLCSGAPVTFTPAPVNGGTSPSYQWFVNGIQLTTNTGAYTSSALNNSDVVRCKLIATGCTGLDSAFSNFDTIHIGGPVTPTISVAPSSATVCSGTTHGYTASITNGGTSPSYQWKIDGTNTGPNSNIFGATLTANSTIQCILTSNAGCLTTNTASSNVVSVTVYPSSPPVVSISASPSSPVCSYTPVGFNATVTNGGTTPQFVWYVNNIDVQNGGTSYTNYLHNGDVIKCMVYNNECVTPYNGTSNSFTYTVNPVVTPSVTLQQSPAGAVCTGTNITFTANAVNGGTLPIYNWSLNGAHVGSNSPTYSGSAFNTGDVIKCQLTSNAPCATVTTVNSNADTLIIQNVVIPAVTISASQTTFCAGTPVIFTALPNGGGTAPAYQWRLNGVNTGATSAAWTTALLNNADVISCLLTSNLSCASPDSAISNTIPVSVIPLDTPAVAISANPATATCPGTLVTFTALPTNGGLSPAYQWMVNGNNAGTNAAAFSSTAFNNNDLVKCKLTGSAACSVNPALSNQVTVSVIQPAGSNLATNICQGNTYLFGGHQLSVAGTYYDTLVAVSGCDSIVTLALTVSPNPAISTLHDTAVCPGSSLTLLAAAPGSNIVWQAGYASGQNVIVNQNTSFILTATDSIYGCTSNDTFTVSVLALAGSMNNTDTVICTGDTIILAASAGSTYNWYGTVSGPISTGSLVPFAALISQEIVVQITGANGCTLNDSFHINVLPERVWPGDANEDLVVNNFDILAIGLAYGATGPVRAGASLTWVEQCAPAWVDTFSNGVNYAYADCNGDGVIDYNDTMAVNLNYSLVHARSSYSRSGNQPLIIQCNGSLFHRGDTVKGQVLLGDSASPSNGVYGIAFTLEAGGIVQPNTFTISQVNSWLIPAGGGINFEKSGGASTSYLAQTRIDHQNVSGLGVIANFSFIADNIATDSLSAYISATNVLLVNSNGDIIGTTQTSAYATVSNLTTAIGTMANINFTVYPNPANDKLVVLIDGLIKPESAISLTNSIGQQVLNQTCTGNKTELNIGNTPGGTYIVNILLSDGLVLGRRKVVIVH